MKKTRLNTFALTALVAATAISASAGKKPWSPFIGAKYYATHTAMDDLPFTKGDIGFVGGAEFRDTTGVMQLLVTYAPGLDGKKWLELENEQIADYVITPEINVIAEDQGWRAGAGILMSYVATDLEKDWTSLYYQFLMGYAFGDEKWKLSFMGDYPFEGISKLKEFEFKDINYGIQLRVTL